MKLRHPFLLKAAGMGAAWTVKLWLGTLRHKYRPLGPNLDPNHPGLKERYIYAFWHENLLLPAYHFGRPDIWVLISRHADGQVMAEACRHLSFRLVRGSTTRGGVEAVRQLVKMGRKGHLGITPDGPKGPRRIVQPGLIYLAARTGLPIAPCGFSYDRPWRLRSWDRFALPRPYSLSTCVTAEPIHVPEDADKNELEWYRQTVEDALNWATAAAEDLAKQAA
jgi:lysophospholipid acyltransferase (LPLAT)-like uncharacterized protein